MASSREAAQRTDVASRGARENASRKPRSLGKAILLPANKTNTQDCTSPQFEDNLLQNCFATLRFPANV
jgi:hypothetical protein